jgi:filamentous hemagglutinin family protein
MNTLFKDTFKNMNIVKSFRKMMAFILVFSLFWQNNLWAIGILEEDLERARIRTYGHAQIGIVEPRSIKNNAVHNVFEDLQLLEGGGIVFKTDPHAGTIYNRVYNEHPIHLSGVIEVDRDVPMVFANPGGITLKNPDFKRVHDLTLIAGGLAQTNAGMAYGVNQGTLNLKRTFFEDQNDLKSISLAGREIDIQRSLLSPSESITLTTGQHIKNLEQGDWFAPHGFSLSTQNAIYLDPATIMRSKRIFLQSLDEGAAIHAKGLLQATDEDIIIKARGDIYLDKLIAHRNLTIETTGKVFFGEQTLVGGTVRVKAENITIDKELSSIGQLYLKASKHLSVNGILGSKDSMKLIGQEAMALKGNITSLGTFKAASKGGISQEGSLFSENLVKIKGQNFIKSGGIISQGFIKISTEGDIENQSGTFGSSSWSKFSSKIGKIINKGRILATGEITLDAKHAQNNGLIHTQDILKTNNNFFNEIYGVVEAKSLALPLAVLSRNSGKIELQDDIKFTSRAAILKGNIKTQGKIKVEGQELTIAGHIAAQNGFFFDNLEKLINRGLISAFGEGLQGKLAVLHNGGKIDLSMANAWIGRSINQKNGVIRTRGHFLLQGDHYHNEGKVFTCGVHQTTLKGSYGDTGIFYSPTLFLLNAREINYFSPHKSYFKDAVMVATSQLMAGEKVSFVLAGNQSPCFLQLSSKGDLSYNGEVRQFTSNQFPLLEYFNISGQAPVFYQDFAKDISFLPLGPWAKMKKSLGSGITLQAGKNINCKKAVIDPESGSINLMANGQFYTEGARLKAGYFQGNNASIHSKTATLNNTQLSSLFGMASLFAQDSATIKDSCIAGRHDAEVRAPSITAESSTVKSSQGTASIIAQDSATVKDSRIVGRYYAEIRAPSVTAESSTVKSSQGKALIQGTDTAKLTHTSVKGRSSAGVKGGAISLDASHIQSEEQSAFIEATHSANIHQSRIEGKRTFLDGGERLTLSLSSLEGEYNKLTATHLSTTSNTIKGLTTLDAKTDLKVNGLQVEGVVFATAPRIDFSGMISTTSLSAEGSQLRNTGILTAKESLRLKGETVEQLGKTKAGGDSQIEASKSYSDTTESLNEAGGTLSLIAEGTSGFKGYQKAGKTLVVKLQDMNLLTLLNQTEAPVTEARLRDGDIRFSEDFTLNRTLHLWAKRLENKAKFTATQDFIAHIQTSIMNQGSIDIHGKGFLEGKEDITTKDIKARKGLGLKTDALLTLKGIADGGEGALSVEAGKIDADAVGTSVSTFSGTGVYLTSQSGILARGGRILSQGDAQILAEGTVDFDAVAYDAGDRTRYLSSLYQVRGNLGIQTSGRYIGRALQSSVGGNFFLRADQGVNLDSLASVYEAERWSYRTGIFDQNRHYGFREEAEFFRTNLTSQGKMYIWSPDGGISAKGASFFGADSITLDASGKVDLGALKATVRHHSYDESGFRGFLGSIDERSGSTERFQSLYAGSNRKIGIFSRHSTIESEAPYFVAPELELYGDRGVFFRPIALHTEEENQHSHFTLSFSPTSLGFEYGKQSAHTKLTQECAGTLQVDHLIVGTGKGAEALFVTNITGMSPGTKTDITADTDKITFAGTNNQSERKTDSLTVGLTVDLATGMPGGGFDVSHDEGKKTSYAATVQNFGVFHNKRKGAKLIVQGGAQATIEKTMGEDMEALVDHNAQDTQSQSGYGFGVQLSSTSIGAHGSIKGGGKTSSDQLTRLNIKESTNKMTRTDISHEDRVKDDRWGIGVGFMISDKGASASLQAQYGDRSFSATLPLDKNPLDALTDLQSFQMPTSLESLHKMTEQLSVFNANLNRLGIDTGGIGDAINMTHQGAQIASQVTHFVDQARSWGTPGAPFSIPTDLDSFSKMTEQLSIFNANLNRLGVNTGGTGDVLSAVQQGTQVTSQSTYFVGQARSWGTPGASFPISTDLDSFSKMTEQLSVFNANLNRLGIETGEIADILDTAHRGTQLVGQTADFLDRAPSLSVSSVPLPISTDLQRLQDFLIHNTSIKLINPDTLN